MTDLSLAKRELVLDLVCCIRLANENNIRGLISFVPITQHRAITILQFDKNWRKHKVRSKSYKGSLGDLFDRFSEYHSDLFIKV